MVLKLPLVQKRMFWTFEKTFFSFFCEFLSDELETVKARQCCKMLFHKVCFVGRFLENAFQALFDHFRQLLLEFLNIWTVLNVSIWIFKWSYSNETAILNSLLSLISFYVFPLICDHLLFAFVMRKKFSIVFYKVIE